MSFLKKKIAGYWILPIVVLTVVITFMTTYVTMKVQAHLDKNNAYLQSTYTDDPTFLYVKQLFFILLHTLNHHRMGNSRNRLSFIKTYSTIFSAT